MHTQLVTLSALYVTHTTPPCVRPRRRRRTLSVRGSAIAVSDRAVLKGKQGKDRVGKVGIYHAGIRASRLYTVIRTRSLAACRYTRLIARREMEKERERENLIDFECVHCVRVRVDWERRKRAEKRRASFDGHWCVRCTKRELRKFTKGASELCVFQACICTVFQLSAHRRKTRQRYLLLEKSILFFLMRSWYRSVYTTNKFSLFVFRFLISFRNLKPSKLEKNLTIFSITNRASSNAFCDSLLPSNYI